jgi:putative membrane protein
MPAKKKALPNSSSGFGRLLFNLTVNTFALLVVEYILPGFVLENLQTAAVAAIVMGAINTFIRPVVQFLALPFTIVTLGIAAFLINVGFLMLVAAIVPGFNIDSFLTAAIASILLTLVTWFLNKISRD